MPQLTLQATTVKPKMTSLVTSPKTTVDVMKMRSVNSKEIHRTEIEKNVLLGDKSQGKTKVSLPKGSNHSSQSKNKTQRGSHKNIHSTNRTAPSYNIAINGQQKKINEDDLVVYNFASQCGTHNSNATEQTSMSNSIGLHSNLVDSQTNPLCYINSPYTQPLSYAQILSLLYHLHLIPSEDETILRMDAPKLLRVVYELYRKAVSMAERGTYQPRNNLVHNSDGTNQRHATKITQIDQIDQSKQLLPNILLIKQLLQSQVGLKDIEWRQIQGWVIKSKKIAKQARLLESLRKSRDHLVSQEEGKRGQSVKSYRSNVSVKSKKSCDRYSKKSCERMENQNHINGSSKSINYVQNMANSNKSDNNNSSSNKLSKQQSLYSAKQCTSQFHIEQLQVINNQCYGIIKNPNANSCTPTNSRSPQYLFLLSRSKKKKTQGQNVYVLLRDERQAWLIKNKLKSELSDQTNQKIGANSNDILVQQTSNQVSLQKCKVKNKLNCQLLLLPQTLNSVSINTDKVKGIKANRLDSEKFKLNRAKSPNATQDKVPYQGKGRQETHQNRYEQPLRHQIIEINTENSSQKYLHFQTDCYNNQKDVIRHPRLQKTPKQIIKQSKSELQSKIKKRIMEKSVINNKSQQVKLKHHKEIKHNQNNRAISKMTYQTYVDSKQQQQQSSQGKQGSFNNKKLINSDQNTNLTNIYKKILSQNQNSYQNKVLSSNQNNYYSKVNVPILSTKQANPFDNFPPTPTSLPLLHIDLHLPQSSLPYRLSIYQDTNIGQLSMSVCKEIGLKYQEWAGRLEKMLRGEVERVLGRISEEQEEEQDEQQNSEKESLEQYLQEPQQQLLQSQQLWRLYNQSNTYNNQQYTYNNQQYTSNNQIQYNLSTIKSLKSLQECQFYSRKQQQETKQLNLISYQTMDCKPSKGIIPYNLSK